MDTLISFPLEEEKTLSSLGTGAIYISILDVLVIILFQKELNLILNNSVHAKKNKYCIKLIDLF